ncbi:MAG: cryptochrome/photolyase family protein [Devosia sp.]
MSTKTLRLILGDQLTADLSALRDIDRENDIVLMAEVNSASTTVPYHKQKLVLIFAAMRHFADDLRADGIAVDYVSLDDAENSQSLGGELARAVARHQPQRIVVTEPGAHRALLAMRGWSARLGLPVFIRDDDRFVCSRRRFAAWAHDREGFRMEHFYREMRRDTGYLMDGANPVGGQWNFDHDNRGTLPKGHQPPRRQRFEPDAITQGVIALVGRHFAGNFGETGHFGWAVTRRDALAALDHFITDALPDFGRYQDAMQTGAPFLYHAILSPYLNIGLLTPREVCDAAAAAYAGGAAPLNAVEGFIRQIIGWREYMRGLYWHLMPDYAQTNALDAHRPLPWLYWSGQTELNCLHQVIGETRRNGYAHHIQRLMVTGNFALLAGIVPAQIEAWYLAVYVDAYDWVELPNTHGMVMFADGGVLASKPYAASGAYINRMSDYCGACRYDPKIRSGPGACPFNLLYWNFLDANQARLRGNARMAMPYKNLNRLAPAEREAIRDEATAFLDSLADGPEAAPAPVPRQLSMDL